MSAPRRAPSILPRPTPLPALAATALVALLAVAMACEERDGHSAAAPASPAAPSSASTALSSASGSPSGSSSGAPASAPPSAKPDTTRIVAVGGAVTEIVCAVGLCDRLVGVDASSVHPARVQALPQVGYQRTLSAEGILSLSPTLVLASSEAGPPSALEQLRAAGVRLVTIEATTTPEGALARVSAVADAIGAVAAVAPVTAALREDLDSARRLVARAGSRPRVLFLYARGGGTLLVAGTATSADAMIRLAGGDNAITAFEGFKPLTAEAVAAAAPEVLLVTARGLDSLGGLDAALALPGLASTPVARSRRVLAVDDLLLLGFGPRLGHAVRELAVGLHPELARAP